MTGESGVELKPCPHCNGKVHLTHAHHITYVLCDGCGAITSFRGKTEQSLNGSKAISAWNARA